MNLITTDPKSMIFKTTDGFIVFLMKPGQTERARCTCMKQGCEHTAAVAVLVRAAAPAATVTVKPQSKPAVVRPAAPVVAAHAAQAAVTPEQAAAVMRQLVARMAADAGLQVQVVFRNKRGSYHKTIGPKRHLIVFGWQCLENYMTHGFRDYKSIDWIVPKAPRPTGIEAGKWLAYHEFAHALQTEIPGGRTYGSCHNATFVACYKEVLSKYR